MAGELQLDLERFRARLLEKQTELEAGSRSTAEEREPVGLDQQQFGRLSRMDAIQQQAMALEAERRRQIELKRIAAALGRIEAGDFGYCTACGEPIARKRLELDPSVAICVECAAKT
jgi:DnaK suppressor protein